MNCWWKPASTGPKCQFPKKGQGDKSDLAGVSSELREENCFSSQGTRLITSRKSSKISFRSFGGKFFKIASNCVFIKIRPNFTRVHWPTLFCSHLTDSDCLKLGSISNADRPDHGNSIPTPIQLHSSVQLWGNPVSSVRIDEAPYLGSLNELFWIYAPFWIQ